MISVLLAALLAATNPIDYGAKPDDGIDDGPAVRAAVEEACISDHSIILEGMFVVDQEQGKLGGINLTNCQGLVFQPIGAAGFEMVPKYNTGANYDYYLINIDGGSSNIVMDSITLDGHRDEFTGTAEQVHLVRTYVASNLTFNNVVFKNSFGAGIKLINSENVLVSNSTFTKLNRGGVEGHSNNVGLRITNNSFTEIVDQHIASEGGGGNSNWVISSNTHGPHGTGSLLVYDLAHGLNNFVVNGNVIVDGGVQLYHTEHFVFSNNNVRTTFVGAPTLVYLKGKNSYGTISNNYFYSAGTDSEIYCLRVAGTDATRDPKNLVISGNTCLHAGPIGISVISGEGRINVSNNVVESLAASGGVGIQVSQLLNKDQRAVSINSNSITNEDIGILVSVAACTTCTQDDIAINGNVVYSTKPNSKGFYNQVSDHFGIPFATKCRGDANVFDVLGAKWTSTGTVGWPPAGQGCIQHGDAVP